MARNQMAQSLQALASLTGTDPYATDPMSLDARSRLREQTDTADADAAYADQQFNPENPYFGMNRNMLMERPSQQQARTNIIGGGRWNGLFEAIREAGERQGKNVNYGGLEGIRTAARISPFSGTVPLSMQDLPGIEYLRTAGGRPIGMQYRR